MGVQDAKLCRVPLLAIFTNKSGVPVAAIYAFTLAPPLWFEIVQIDPEHCLRQWLHEGVRRLFQTDHSNFGFTNIRHVLSSFSLALLEIVIARILKATSASRHQLIPGAANLIALVIVPAFAIPRN